MAESIISPQAVTAPEDAIVSHLLSRVLSGSKICKAAELAAFLPRWLSEIKENKPVSPDIPELLAHLLLPFGTSAILEHIERLQVPDSLTDRQKWMVKLLVLMDNKAHERLLQKLGSIPDQQISFEDLCEQENAQEDNTDDDLVIDPKRTLQFDYDMRGVMTRGDKDAMRKHTDVFYVTGSVAWTVRSPYWNVALATDDEGNRILSDDVLDKVLPKWRQILTGETIPTPKYGVVDSFRSWLVREEKKASDLGKPWPNPPVHAVSSASNSKFIGPKTPEPYSRLRSVNAIRLSPLESTPNVTDSEQTELLREILTEIRELKNMISQNFQRKQELEIAERQTHEYWQQGYPPIPQGMQANYLVPQQGPFDVAQHHSLQLESDWQRWNSQYQDPTTMPGPGTDSSRRL
ncbi:hypothetical protein Pdw03_3462 [Penicillium digitatum]|uniref:Uncharacterized protein n=3 Tax=Penicillium digitatum TaxID=36651 RepID=K9FEZ5_PEND2|nr:hypothetical protein PDIP_80080 [Penicillium digitatum Pd1]EKV06297.1 hypothetical protein PDIP_80080 [Penicillium digitatum Pd1]EKV08000.1 hypothetical protein PDIG_70760 [Penicillium digitatum PHI26]QQK40608.1 hypothetical protein Pdw03_3462 [Penicillium digitatum]